MGWISMLIFAIFFATGVNLLLASKSIPVGAILVLISVIFLALVISKTYKKS